MEDTVYTTKESILKRAQEIKGIPLKLVDKSNRISTGKGAIGTVVEESWFGYTPNSESKPDFSEAGIELKVTPYIRNSKGISAKERLVCNIINYMEEYRQTFFTSAFWHKCNTMLLLSYEHKPGIDKGDFTIDETTLFQFPEEDLVIIEKDWETIISKVRNGEAHLISEGDTLYLAACTKGVNANSVRKQPFSEILAKQRAYSLKASYMTYVLRTYIFGDVQNEKIIKDWHLLEESSFENIITNRVSKYFGKTQAELIQLFNVEKISKNINEILLSKMLNVKGKIAYTAEFQKANIVPKTIRINKKGTIKESMSFPYFKFLDIIEETWEDSTLYNYLAPTKFFFVIFQENNNGEYVFERIKFWNIPVEDLEEVHKVWERTVLTIKNGVRLTPTPQGITNNLPKMTESKVAHVRPHAKDSSDTLPLPDGRVMPKQCFWLNNSYILSQIMKEK